MKDVGEEGGEEVAKFEEERLMLVDEADLFASHELPGESFPHVILSQHP